VSGPTKKSSLLCRIQGDRIEINALDRSVGQLLAWVISFTIDTLIVLSLVPVIAHRCLIHQLALRLRA
jgi:hypothetical protein